MEEHYRERSGNPPSPIITALLPRRIRVFTTCRVAFSVVLTDSFASTLSVALELTSKADPDE